MPIILTSSAPVHCHWNHVGQSDARGVPKTSLDSVLHYIPHRNIGCDCCTCIPSLVKHCVRSVCCGGGTLPQALETCTRYASLFVDFYIHHYAVPAMNLAHSSRSNTRSIRYTLGFDPDMLLLWRHPTTTEGTGAIAPRTFPQNRS